MLMFDSDKLGRWLTILTNVSVLVGVIFLVIEVRQNNEFLEFEKYSRSISDLVESGGVLWRDESLASALFEEPSTRTAEQNWRLRTSVGANFNSMQRAWREGYFETNLGIVALYRTAYNSDNPRGVLLKSVWEDHKQVLASDFVEWFYQNVANET
jgi:hypothetical protein